MYQKTNMMESNAFTSKEVLQLKALKTLYLDNNYLHSLPKEMGQLKNLRELKMKKNFAKPFGAEGREAALPEKQIKTAQQNIRALLPGCRISF